MNEEVRFKDRFDCCIDLTVKQGTTEIWGPGTKIKAERFPSPVLDVKKEATAVEISLNSAYRTLIEDNREVLEIISSDEETDQQPQYEHIPSKLMTVEQAVTQLSEDLGLSDVEDSDSEMHERDPHSFLNDYEPSLGSDSDTRPDSDDEHEAALPSIWLDSDIESTIKTGHFRLTRQRHVDVLEFLTDLPSYWPIPKDSRAYIIDLSNPKYDITDKNGKLLTIDALIKNAVSYFFFLVNHKLIGKK